MSDKTLKYLLKKEWSMGNGQCPECEGVPESWFPHPLCKTSSKLGHTRRCSLALAIKASGGTPLFLGQSKLEGEYKFAIKEGEKCFGMMPIEDDGLTMGEVMEKNKAGGENDTKGQGL